MSLAKLTAGWPTNLRSLKNILLCVVEGYVDLRNPGVGGGALECSLTGTCPLLGISTTCSGKKITFQYPVSELLGYKNSRNNRENNSLLF